jgi:hypothetical protein
MTKGKNTTPGVIAAPRASAIAFPFAARRHKNDSTLAKAGPTMAVT